MTHDKVNNLIFEHGRGGLGFSSVHVFLAVVVFRISTDLSGSFLFGAFSLEITHV